MIRYVFVLLFALMSGSALAAPIESFRSFIRSFEPKALAAGVTRETYHAATDDLTPDPDIPDQVAGQPEFTTTVWDYIDKRVTEKRIADGQAGIGRNEALFDRIGHRTGVDPYLLGAIWGIETAYGSVLANSRYIKPVIRSLATLVHQRRSRLKGDEADLIGALLLIQMNHLASRDLVGSWAGAIGHLQVNPSNVVVHGSDGDGDGRIDLHRSLADALATSAKFLLDLGYAPGVDWGFEVEVPAGFDYLLADREQFHPISFFTGLGVSRVRGKNFSDTSLPVFLYAPAGASGPKFLMTRNYLVLKGYNFSDSYALTVAHLTDRLKGAPGFSQGWPRDAKFPNLAQRQAIQQALAGLGYYKGPADGRLGPVSQAAYARFQSSRGEVADGFITLAAYDELMRATQ